MASNVSTQRPRTRVTVEDVKQAIAWRIRTGVHPVSTRLPPVRDLARELGANRNTVNKAYRQLCEAGVVTLSPGKRGFLVCEEGSRRVAVDDLQRRTRDVVWQAMAAGIPREQVLAELTEVVTQVYAAHRLKLAFIECNALDSTEMARQLGQLIGEPIEPLILKEAARRVRSLSRQNDLIITTFHHLAEVGQLFHHCADRVVGVDTRPTPDTLLRVARITSPDIGLICTLENTARSLRHVINSYHPDRTVHVALIDDPEGVRRVGNTCGHVAVTHTAVEGYTRLTRRQPEIVIQFRIDEQSVAYLNQRLRQARLNGNAALLAPPALAALSQAKTNRRALTHVLSSDD